MTWQPMTAAEYRRWRLADMQQHQWRTTRDLRNGYVTIPAKMPVSIDGKRGGLDLTTARCACCGVRAHIRKVGPADVERHV